MPTSRGGGRQKERRGRNRLVPDCHRAALPALADAAGSAIAYHLRGSGSMVPTSPDKFIRAKKESEFGFALARAGFKPSG